MASKKTRTRLLVAGAAAAASAVAFYLVWKAFRSYDEEDPEMDGQDLRSPCPDDEEIQDLENLMKTTEEKRGSKIAEEEQESGFNLEEFDRFIAEEYGEVIADFGTKDVLSSGNGQGKLESCFQVSEIIRVEGDLDGFGGFGIARGREEGTQKNIQFCCRTNEGGGAPEGFVSEFSSMFRDVGFDEMSMQDMSEEDGIILGNAHQASESLRELGGQSATDFEFDGGDSSFRVMALGFNSSGMNGLSRKISEESRFHEVSDLEKSSDVKISFEEEADSSINNGVEALGPKIEISKPSDDILEPPSAKGNKFFDNGMIVDSVQSLKEHNFENLESNESLDSADMDCNGSVGHLCKYRIMSSNGIINKQSDCQREAQVENSDGLISNEHVSLKCVENIEDASLQNPPIENDAGVTKDSDKLSRDLSEDSKKPDVEVSQQPKFDNIDNNHNGLEDIASNEHSALQTGEDLGKQVNGQTNLLQTDAETNKSIRAGNVKFEDHGSHLLSLPHMSSHDESSEQLLAGSRASKLESSMNGGLDAYDAYLADPSLSPSMRSQVTRAKAIAQKLYATKEG